MQGLYDKLMSDIRAVGIDIHFNFELRGYSKTHYGKYFCSTNTVVVYVKAFPNCDVLLPYETLLSQSIHEAIHAIQWNDPNFVRRKGVMHDPEFHALYSKYLDRAKALLLIREIQDEKVHETIRKTSIIDSGVNYLGI